MAVHTDEHLKRIGATSFWEMGLADAAGDSEMDYQKWAESGIIEKIRDRLGIKGAKEKVNMKEFVYDVSFHDVPRPVKPPQEKAKVVGSSILSSFFWSASKVKVCQVYELRQEPQLKEGTSTVHADLDLSGTHVNYMTAGNVEILPENNPQLVDWFVRQFGVENKLDKHISFKCKLANYKPPWNGSPTLREAMTRYLNLTDVPNKNALSMFCLHLENEVDREILNNLIQDKSILNSIDNGACKMTFMEFWLVFFESIKLTIEEFLEICPRQRTRLYTISSSRKETPKTMSLTVSLTLTKSKGELAARLAELEELKVIPRGKAAKVEAERDHFGLSTSWMCMRWKVGDEVLIRPTDSSFRLPPDCRKPIVMIAAGAGIAPMRAFLHEISAQANSARKRVGRIMLFFGCRGREQDFLYKDEITGSQERGELTDFFPAFSREGPKKVYVQHILAEHVEEVKEVTNSGGVIFICGSTDMGNAVIDVLESAGLDTKEMRKKKTLIPELWG